MSDETKGQDTEPTLQDPNGADAASEHGHASHLDDVAAEVQAASEALAELSGQPLDADEVARQLEDITNVVLNSAEVSTRSASVAASIGHQLRAVSNDITDNNKRSILHSRVIMVVFMVFVAMAVGTFFAISTRMQQNIRQLDTITTAAAKRVIELNAAISYSVDSTKRQQELQDKQAEFSDSQTKITARLDDMSKAVLALPQSVADQNTKANDAKMAALEKKLQSLETKMQTLVDKPAPSIGPSQQALMADKQALTVEKQNLNAENQRLKKEIDNLAAKLREKPPAPKPAVAEPKPTPLPKPALKPAPAPKAEVQPEPRPVPVPAPVVVAPEPRPVLPAVPQTPPRERPIQYPRPAD
jgi:SUMO ligase MMS21 Smc5/6 complex component